MPSLPYYREDLARIHHEGFAFHADAVAPGILELLKPVLERGGFVLEIGCGSGLLTKYLVDAGHRVLATDASPAMVDLARAHVPAATVKVLRVPDDALPSADAIVSVGHPLSYLDDEEQVNRALVGFAGALGPDGVLAFDVCDLEWGAARRAQPPGVWFGDDWVLTARFSIPKPTTYRREMTMFVRAGDLWRRDDETHDNVLVDTTKIPALLARHGVDAQIKASFGDETLPSGLVAVVGTRHAQGATDATQKAGSALSESCAAVLVLGYGRNVPFFEPLPPIPEPTVEQPTGWRPPLWDRPSEATIGAPVPVVAVLGKTDRVALVFSNVAAYPNGFTFDLVIQRNPMAPRSANEGPPSWFMGGPPHLRRGPRVGFEFADGTRVAEQGPVPFAGRSLQLVAGSGNRENGIPAGPILVPRGGGGGGHDRFEMGFWLFPLPPRGPMKIYSEWIAVDIAETMTVVDASIIVDAAEQAIVLWDTPPDT